MRKTLFAFAVVTALVACTKHKCELDTEAKKAAFGAIADMTEGAHSCYVEGFSLLDDEIMPDTKCEIGSSDCAPTMDVIHPSPATVKDVAGRYRAFLEKNQWSLEEKTSSGKFGNGKPYEGIDLRAKSGGKTLLIRVTPFGDDMVQTLVLADEKK